MNPDVGVEVLEQGLVASWSRQVRWVPGGSVRRLGGVLVALSAVRDQTQQVAVVYGPVAEPEASVIAAEIVFEQAGWRPAFDLVAGRHPELESVLAARGFSVVVERPGMVRSVVQRDWPDASSPVRLDLATSRDREQIIDLQAQAFGLDADTARGVVPNALFSDADALLIVAREPLEGHVVGSVTIHLDGAIGAILGAAVRAASQRQGVGTALTVAALDLARSHGVETVWLQTTPDGLGVYSRLGFSVAAACQVWLR